MPPGYARARSANGVSVSQGKSGRAPVSRPIERASVAVHAQRQGGDDRVVLVDLTLLRGTAGRPEVVEELDVRPVVLGPLLRDVVLGVDGLDGADRLPRTAVEALVGVDVSDRWPS